MERDHYDDHLERLLAKAHLYRSRYGARDGADLQSRLETAMRRRENRVRQIRAQIEELAGESATLERELLGYRQGLTALLEASIERMQTDHEEGWSPTPVIGFRMWSLRHDRLEGARVPWTSPSLSATCGQGFDDVDIPHSDGRCGRLGCGIYATKDPGTLLVALNPQDKTGYVAGRVALTGKVIEHDDGYRGQHATVVSVVALGRSGTLATDDALLIAALFDAPAATMDREQLISPWTTHMTIEYLTQPGGTPWISANNAA